MSKEDLSRSQDPGAHSDSDTESDDECEVSPIPDEYQLEMTISLTN